MEPRDFSAITTKIQQAFERGTFSDARERTHLIRVKEQIEAVARGDVEALLIHAHPDVRLDIFAPPEFDWIRHAQGTSDVRRAIEHNFSAVTDQRPEIGTVVVQADTVVMMGAENGVVKASGQPYAVEFVHKFQFRDGRLAIVTIIAARRT